MRFEQRPGQLHPRVGRERRCGLTMNAYFLDLKGPATNYNHVNGPTDYRYNST